MKIIEGDLIKLALDGEFDVIVHGCNCFCSMGAGIAKKIKDLFPEAYDADLQTEKGSRDKLGSISYTNVQRGKNEFTIVNGYTQFSAGGSGVLVDYVALLSVMKGIKSNFSGRRIGYPMIGAGLAKGDWSIISEIIDEQLQDENHTLVKYVP
ncbi:MAG: phosphatase [Thermodesulfobacteriota bacterium]